MSSFTSSTGSVAGPSSEDTDNLPGGLDTLEAQILEEGSAVVIQTAGEQAHRAPPGGPFVGAPPSAAAVSVEEEHLTETVPPEHSAQSESGADPSPDAAPGAAAVPAHPPGAGIADHLARISAEIERLRDTVTHPEQRMLRDRRRAELLGEWLMARVHRDGEGLDASMVESLSSLGERESWLWSASMLAADGYVRRAGSTPDEASWWHYGTGAAAREE